MNGLIVSLPNPRAKVGVVPNMAVTSIILYAQRRGVQTDFYDIHLLCPSDMEIRRVLAEKHPSVVGVSAIVSTSYRELKRITGLVREVLPSCRIVVGGNLAESYEVILRKTPVDVCVIGPGEVPWFELMSGKALEDIKGLRYLKDGCVVSTGYPDHVSAGEMELPDYTLLRRGLMDKPFLLMNYFNDPKAMYSVLNTSLDPARVVGTRSASIQTEKGCIGHCVFCQRFYHGYHPYDIGKLDWHIRYLKKTFDVGYLFLADEAFGVDKRNAYAVSAVMRKNNMFWETSAIPKHFTREDLQYFFDCGCVSICFGVESGCDMILGKMNKSYGVEDIRRVLGWCHEIGIYVPIQLCIGCPWETDESIMETGQFVGEMCVMRGVSPIDVNLHIFWMKAYPGSPLYSYGQEHGFIYRTVEEEEQYLLDVSDFDVVKANFFNMTKNTKRHWFFWDYLIYLEALRVYYSVATGETPHGVHKDESIFKRVFRRMPFWLKRFIFVSIPPGVLYPVCRNLVYAFS